MDIEAGFKSGIYFQGQIFNANIAMTLALQNIFPFCEIGSKVIFYKFYNFSLADGPMV